MEVDGAAMARGFARGLLFFSQKQTAVTMKDLLAVQRIRREGPGAGPPWSSRTELPSGSRSARVQTVTSISRPTQLRRATLRERDVHYSK